MEATWKAAQPVTQRHVGHKHYELTDHLGNVRVVVSDMKLSTLDEANEPSAFRAEIVARTDYYVFGSPMPKRHPASEQYRFGFNTQEGIDEIAGEGNHLTAQFWEMDTRIGRRWNVDPEAEQHPEETPYHVLHNNPIYHTDPDGDDPPEPTLGPPGDKVLFRIDLSRKGARRLINANSSGPVLTMLITFRSISKRQPTQVFTGTATESSPMRTPTFRVPPGGDIRFTQGHAITDWGTQRNGTSFSHTGAFGFWGVKAGRNSSASIGWTFTSDYTVVLRERKPWINVPLPKFTWKGGGSAGRGDQSKVNKRKLGLFRRWQQRRSKISL